jgi:hypothetical protein
VSLEDTARTAYMNTIKVVLLMIEMGTFLDLGVPTTLTLHSSSALARRASAVGRLTVAAGHPPRPALRFRAIRALRAILAQGGRREGSGKLCGMGEASTGISQSDPRTAHQIVLVQRTVAAQIDLANAAG